MSRYETKFLINQVQLEYLKDCLRAMLPPDVHVTNMGKYPVFSAYYDTRDLEYFYHKINGEWIHVKVRVRKYSRNLLDNSDAFLEAKIKEGPDQHKIRVKLKASPDILVPAYWTQCDDPRIDFFSHVMSQEMLYHTCNVYYEREAYEFDLFQGEKLRINFDTNLLGLHPFETMVRDDYFYTRGLLDSQTCILEVKYKTDEFPDFIIDTLRRAGVSRGAYSKYASTIEALDLASDRPEVIP